MEVRQLRHFVALSEALNFHRASAALNMTQPPLSMSIRKLELGLGAALFERHARGVTLTEAGAAALPYAREALAAIETLSQTVKETAEGRSGRIRVGFVGSATYALVPAVIPVFRRDNPRIELSLKEATSMEIMRGVEDGSLDVGILRTPLVQTGQIRLQTLYQEELFLMTPADHPVGRLEAVRLEDLKEELFILYDRHQVPNLWSLTLMACEAAGFVPKIADEASHIHTMVALVESGLGLAFAPSIMSRSGAGRVRFVRVTAQDRPLKVGMGLITRQKDRRGVVTAFSEIAGAAGDKLNMH